MFFTGFSDSRKKDYKIKYSLSSRTSKTKSLLSCVLPNCLGWKITEWSFRLVLVLPSSTHGDEDVDGSGRQHDPDWDHDVVKRDVVAVLELQAEHDLSRQFQDRACEIPEIKV